MSHIDASSDVTNDHAGAVRSDLSLREGWPLALLLIAAGTVAALLAVVLIDAYEIPLGNLADWAAVVLAGAALAVVATRRRV